MLRSDVAFRNRRVILFWPLNQTGFRSRSFKVLVRPRHIHPFLVHPRPGPPIRRSPSSSRTWAALASNNVFHEGDVSYPPALQSVRSPSDDAAWLENIQNLLQDEIGASEEWVARVGNAIAELGTPFHTRIGVYGDRIAAPRDLVTALVQDPMSDTTSTRQLLDRRKGEEDYAFHIRHSPELSTSASSLAKPSSWLQTGECEILEVAHQSSSSTLSDLLRTDFILLILDPIRLLEAPSISPLIPYLFRRGGVQLVVNGPLPPGTSENRLEKTLSKQIKAAMLANDVIPSPDIPFSFVDSTRAIEALDALSYALNASDSLPDARSLAFQTFQTSFLASNIGNLQIYLLSRLRTSRPPADWRAVQVGRLALNHANDILQEERNIIGEIEAVIDDLRRSAIEAATRVQSKSVVGRGIDGGLIQGGVEDILMDVRQDLKRDLGARYTFLQLALLGAADDLGSDLASTIRTRFGTSLQQNITFEAGQLAEVQAQLSRTADETVRKLSSPQSYTCPSHPLTSPVLLNHLSALSLSIPPLSPASLHHALRQRRDELLAACLPRLHKAASRSVLASYAIASSSIMSTWIMAVPPIQVISPGLAFGLGLLSVLSSIALGQRQWNRAQKVFWRDWERSTKVIREDLQNEFLLTVQSQVIAKPLTAADGLRSLIEKRRRRLDRVQDKLIALSPSINPQSS
ncbi:hypothetical protein TREMEDRAFT_44343 [Tremella mesenterica DSM 1558]|uniref:uncharacterized protein n=1 Tax=Tremella mesenterica (strain ATCC 24925 / CBS 8224 / DSM 1558 / NBRC 9311 / NRRL Y-6157 / RJB 2259-6 / UBC 559-6) TaxID=578456 RepID=UPI0003F4A1A8|nr:uncharacterized protein TREMEDRAFT_44343 [Tremella mesenterica DSM 1558]EIW69179.1 hypothetical protein TREMEDRAFT_44343 [Tremella mesenterica DSM 1558]